MAISAPGGVSWLWALVYIIAGAYLVPMILGMVKGRAAKKDA